MSKTLGQIAYEAAAEFWETDNEAAWEAAAQAVAHATVASNAFHPITLAKEDVIEAARALERELADDEVPPGKPREAWQRLHAVMEALDKAEVG